MAAQPTPTVTGSDIRAAVQGLDLAGRPLCVHASLRSFGHVQGGAATLVEGLLAEGCTLLVPTFSWRFAVPPPPDQRPARNGWDYSRPGPADGIDRIFTPESGEVDRTMGRVPAAVLAMPGRVRGDHPLNSFTAVGPLAAVLVAGQTPEQVYAPLEALARAGGFVILMGVGLTRLTLLHLAEQRAGRQLFRRWANGPDDRPVTVQVGSCSDGFDNLAPALAPLRREASVGQSRWQVFPAAATLDAATAAIRADPHITHCGDPGCERCNDAVLGGPKVSNED